MSHEPQAGFVVIGGCERSGTTLLSRLLGGHPDVHHVPTDMVVFDRYDACRQWTGVREPTSRESLQAVCRKLITHKLVGKWGLTATEVERTSGRFKASWDGVFLTLAYALAEKHPGKLICFKHPTAEAHFPRVRKLFEDQGDSVRFLYCVRSPFDVYRSWKHRAAAWAGGEVKDPRPIRWSSDWLSSTTEALNASYALGKLMRVVRYEDLVRDTSGRTAELCRFLGIDDTRSGQMIASLDTMVANSSFEFPSEPRTGIINTLERKGVDLSNFEMNVIRIACGKRAATFGFDLGEPDKTALGNRKIEYELALERIPTRSLLYSLLRLLWHRTGVRVRSNHAPRNSKAVALDAP